MLKDTANKGFFEITINLTTEKGINIIAGLLKIENQDIIYGQGQNIVFGLYNCLDSNAKCQIKVNKVKKVKIRKDKNRIRTISGATSLRSDLSDEKYYGQHSNIVNKDKDKNWRQSHRLIEEGKETPYEYYRESRLSPMDKDISQRKKSEYSRDKYKIHFDNI
jgi:hypothetical protein